MAAGSSPAPIPHCLYCSSRHVRHVHVAARRGASRHLGPHARLVSPCARLSPRAPTCYTSVTLSSPPPPHPSQVSTYKAAAPLPALPSPRLPHAMRAELVTRAMRANWSIHVEWRAICAPCAPIGLLVRRARQLVSWSAERAKLAELPLPTHPIVASPRASHIRQASPQLRWRLLR